MLFMLLGIVLFFDGVLLALGNVSSTPRARDELLAGQLRPYLAPSLLILVLAHQTLRQLASPSPRRRRRPQILFLSGLTLIIGARKTLLFFSRKEKLRGSVCFFLGIALVFLKVGRIRLPVQAGPL
jgi:hypothetical protein